MEIDIRTLSVIAPFVYILEALALGFLYLNNKKYPGIACWVLGSILVSVGYLCMLLRDITTNLFIAIILPNILIISGFIVIYIGVLRFIDKKENRGLILSLLVLFTAVFSFFTYVITDITVRTAIVSVFLALFFLLMARELSGKKYRAIGYAAHFLVAILLILVAFLLLRSVIVLTIVPVESFFTPTSFQTASVILLFFFGFLFIIGLIILVNQRLNAEVTEAKKDFEMIFHYSPAGLLISRLDDGRIVDVNAGFLTITGFSREDVIESPAFEDQFCKNLGDRQIATEALTRNGMYENSEAVLHRKDGTVIICDLSAKIVSLQGNAHIVWMIRDITWRKRAEEQRELFLKELARKNAELDRFTYTVSHDLKSPLITIRGFLSVVEEEIQSGKTEQVPRHLQLISESAEKLEFLITTLLSLSRNGRSVNQPVQIPLADLATEAARMLEAPLVQRGVTLVIKDDLPVVQGDRQRLLQVMTNLLDNAVKFMGDQAEPRVEVGITQEESGPVFFVRDNGAGIKQEDLSRLFVLYERLNPEVPGTGIGLSTVKQIIEAHGGKIWAESEGPGKGTTFRFTLPVAPDTHEI